ncbi:diguanylate cyclase [Chromohalobacter marismortui]|uniref:Diguanylate cyclase n=1 Tax=Chromohalobacter marismortui TaxID=42055 RepID=A0A4R7NWU4_9GAMM|nr:MULTISPECIES: diguanylate cyclase [Chromohalobacter]MCI0510434.1 diguanylate cyclase [Chromohalobacter sp.]MCI0594688.1 diguanylate cyclase [Chromohalobacter sp.]TDU24990.1 diguanylate cyclase [Chromohalobacter marismortui]
MPERLASSRLHAIAYTCGALVLASLATWHYLMGHYPRILPISLLTLMVSIAALMAENTDARRLPAYLVLISGYLAIAVEAPYLATSGALWMGVPPILATLLLPSGAALFLNVLLAPMWLLLINPVLSTPAGGMQYFMLVILSMLPLGWYMQQTRLLKTTDQLDTQSGILARDALSERLIAEVARARALNQSLSVLVMHIPQLDMANEQFGQTAQDTLLTTFCQVVQRNSRLGDALGRHSHSVFWLLLADAGEAGALIVRERVTHALAETPLPEFGTIKAQARICRLADDESAERFEQRLISRGFNLLEPET